MSDGFDLFGNPLEPACKGAGRPEHVPTEETTINIMVLLASGHTNREVAQVVGISVPTLRKHYLHLTKKRDVILARLRAKLRTEQIKQGLAGNASSLNNAIKVLDQMAAENAASQLRKRAANAPEAKARPKGLKEQRIEAARNVGGKFAVPNPPRLIVSNGGGS